jgi:hypothetical protein
MSEEPPGGKGTTMVIGLSGYAMLWADAQIAVTPANNFRSLTTFIAMSPVDLEGMPASMAGLSTPARAADLI